MKEKVYSYPTHNPQGAVVPKKQKEKLEVEGIEVINYRVDLKKYGYNKSFIDKLNK